MRNYRCRMWVFGVAVVLGVAGFAFGGDGLNRTIAVFGSSVASGVVDKEENKGGYAGRLGTLLESRGWSLVNVSRSGDNTNTIKPRFDAQLLPQKPGVVIIGLSLANQGLVRAKTPEQRAKVAREFTDGLKDLINRLRENKIQPVIGLCYPQNCYDSRDYEVLRRVNIDLNAWDVPSINFLGTTDDGTGKWVTGYFFNAGHPNSAGHSEMFLAMVPSLYDAIAAGKPTPKRVERHHSTVITTAPLTFEPQDTIHSFTVSFRFKTGTRGGTVASIDQAKGTPLTIGLTEGRLTYSSPAGRSIVSTSKASDNQWHEVTLSHRYAKGETLFFVDGQLVGTVAEQVIPARFILGGSAKAGVGYKDWLVYRAALNLDEARALADGQLLQASLELYAPLSDPDHRYVNLAQSLGKIKTNQ